MQKLGYLLLGLLTLHSARAVPDGVPTTQEVPSSPGQTLLGKRVSVKPLDLSRAPTTDELMAAGQLGGPLFPTHELKDSGRDEAARWAFGQAIEQWNRHEYGKAVGMFRKYVAEYPDSPWAAEAELHIGCDASYNGRYTEADALFNKLITDHQGEEHPGAKMLLNKARQRLALLRVEQNNLDEASLHFRTLLQDSPDWRQRTYASHWLQRLSRYTAAGRALVNCGAEALAYALEKEGRRAAAAQVRTNLPATLHGHSLASLAGLAARQGLELAAIQATTTDLARLPLPAILHITPQHSGDKGHYWILDRVHGEQFELFDPQSERRFQQSPAELAKEWSGKALVFSKGGTLPGRRLDFQEMQEASGGCCGLPRKEDDLGCTGSHGQGGGSQGGCPGCGQMAGLGSPVWSVNLINMNLFVSDTPLWYDPPIGPAVSITLSCNSQSALARNEPFGNKWQFNYASYLVVDTAGTVLIFMPDGARNVYTPDGAGGYTRPYQVYNTLARIAPNSFELRFPDDTVYVYQIPAGTDSEQPFLVEIRDAWGQRLSFGYDADVRLTTITDALGLVTTLSYNPVGLVTAVADPFGRQATFQYDSGGNLARATDMGGHWSSYTYDANAYLTSISDERGSWAFRIEPADGVNNGSDPYPPPGGTMYQNYRISVTDPLGYSSEYHYDGYWSYSWYVSPRYYIPWRSEYENNYMSDVPKTCYFFDNMDSGRQGEITIITYPGGGEVEYGYDSKTGGQVSITDAHGHTLSCAYNSMGQITSLTDPLDTPATLTYAANGIDLLSVANGLGRVVATYDAYHQVTSDKDRLANITRYEYNAFGQTTLEVDALGITNEYIYDAGHRLWQISRDGQVLKTMTYDPIGRVVTQTDATGLTLTNDYNALDQLARITFPDGKFISYVYSPCCPGLLESVTDRAGRTTRFTYDALKRLTQVTGPDNSLTRYSYDANGNPIHLVDANGNITSFTYDPDDRLVRKTYADGTALAFAYDETGLLINRTDARGIVTTYIYDANHQLTLTLYSDGTPGVTNRYDSFGRLVQRQDGMGAQSFSYDANSQLTSYDGPWANDTIVYGYDAVGQVTNSMIQGGPGVGYTWDKLGRLSAVNLGNSVYQYSFAGSSRLVQQLARPNGSTTSYRYDGLNRLTEISNRRSTGQVINDFLYAYNSQDMLVSETVSNGLTISLGGANFTGYQYNPLNQPTNSSPANQSFAHDAGGNLTRGFTPGGEAFVAAYDAENRLRSLTYTNLGGTVRQLQYLYDGYGLLAEIKDYRNSSLNKDTRFVRDDGFLVLQERDGSNSVVRDYTWGASLSGAIGGLLELAQGGQHYSYVYDGKGNVTGLLDSTQAAAASYAYDAFGGLLAKTGALDQLIGFSTMPYDEGAGLTLFPYRAYSPSLGRWLGRDPLGEGAGPNLYAFVGNNPVQNLDPQGLFYPVPPPNGNWANALDQVLSQLGGYGTIICQGNKIVPYISPRAPKSQCIQECLKAHEKAHAQDAEKTNPGICKGKKTGTVIAPSSERERADSEVNAYNAERDCLKKQTGCNKKDIDDRLDQVNALGNKNLADAVQATLEWAAQMSRRR